MITSMFMIEKTKIIKKTNVICFFTQKSISYMLKSIFKFESKVEKLKNTKCEIAC